MVTITIDTEKDSKEHIQKSIQFLQSILNKTEDDDSKDMFSMFDTSSKSQVSSGVIPEEDDKDSNFFSVMEY